MRKDVQINNEAGAFTLVSRRKLGNINDEAFDPRSSALAGEVVAVELSQDDFLSLRFVIDEALSVEESGWMTQATGRLEVPDGKLVVYSGAGPGSARLVEDDEMEDWFEELTVPPGSWRVDVYSCLGGINARDCEEGEEGWGRPMVQWFRETRGGEAIPLWLAILAADYPGDFDPDHAELWADLRASVDAGDLKLELSRSGPPDFVVQLRPWTDEVECTPLTQRGWLPWDAGRRNLERFPDWIASEHFARDPTWLDLEVAPEPTEPAEPDPTLDLPWPTSPVALPEAAAKTEPTSFGEWNTVFLRSELFAYVFELATYLAPQLHAELRVELAKGQSAESLPVVPPPSARLPAPNASTLRLGFDAGAPEAVQAQLAAIAPFVRSLPNGSRVTVLAARPSDDAGEAVVFTGMHDGGVWQLDAMHPSFPRELVQDALTDLAEPPPKRYHVLSDRQELSAVEAAYQARAEVADLVEISFDRRNRWAVAKNDSDTEPAFRLLRELTFRHRFGERLGID